jgi:hypothetical protein
MEKDFRFYVGLDSEFHKYLIDYGRDSMNKRCFNNNEYLKYSGTWNKRGTNTTPKKKKRKK